MQKILRRIGNLFEYESPQRRVELKQSWPCFSSSRLHITETRAVHDDVVKHRRNRLKKRNAKRACKVHTARAVRRAKCERVLER